VLTALGDSDNARLVQLVFWSLPNDGLISGFITAIYRNGSKRFVYDLDGPEIESLRGAGLRFKERRMEITFSVGSALDAVVEILTSRIDSSPHYENSGLLLRAS
jgi:hypothetical protein